MKLITLSLFTFFAVAGIAATKTYQVTGPVLDVKDNVITIQKGKERWELTRDASTKVNGNLKVGEKATITYTMNAADVEVKTAKATKGTKKTK